MNDQSLQRRLRSVRQAITDAGVDALLITDMTNVGYLTGFQGSTGLVLVGSTFAMLITDARYAISAPGECPHFAVCISAGSGSYVDTLVEQCAGKGGLRVIGCEGASIKLSLWQQLHLKLPAMEWKATDRIVERLRSIKDGGEVSAIVAAIQVAEEAFLAVKPMLRAGIAERDFAVELDYAMRRAGAECSAFETIVASGALSALPHHHSSGRRLAPGDWVIVDWGATLNGYCSDITRTFLIGQAGPATCEQQRVYGIVQEAGRRAVSAIVASRTGKEIDAVARGHIASQGYGNHFIHSLGHALGRCVHDGLGFSTQADGVILQPGMVFTVEPGIYIENWGGIRIEDDILVTDVGCEVLTRLPSELEFLG